MTAVFNSINPTIGNDAAEQRIKYLVLFFAIAGWVLCDIVALTKTRRRRHVTFGTLMGANRSLRRPFLSSLAIQKPAKNTKSYFYRFTLSPTSTTNHSCPCWSKASMELDQPWASTSVAQCSHPIQISQNDLGRINFPAESQESWHSKCSKQPCAFWFNATHFC